MKKKYFLIIILTVILIAIISIIIISKVKDNHKNRDDIEIGKTNEGTEENMTDDIELQENNEENVIEDETKNTNAEVVKQEETQELAEKGTAIISSSPTNMPKSTTYSSSNIPNNIIASTNNNDEHDDVLGGLVSTVNGTTVNKTTTEQAKLTGTEKQKNLTKTETKYGVIISTYTTTTYNVYSDGNKTVKSTSNSTEYDRSNYNATTSELLAEAKTARSKYASMLNKVIENTNAYRQEANANSVNGIVNRTNLTLDEKLCITASVRAVEMAYSGNFSHTRPNGGNIGNELGTRVWGENIARGQKSADSVSKSWKNSAGHYSNMIAEKYTKIGVGHFELDGTHYWVQLFT